MSHQSPLSQWIETVSSMLPKLSRPQAKVLAYWSFGMVLARSCGITLVCAALALQVDSSEQSLLQRLREWCYGAEDKKGKKRRDLDVSTCFGPLLQWILAWWPADEPRLALALDATTFCETNDACWWEAGCIEAVLLPWRGKWWALSKREPGSRIGLSCWSS